MSKVLRCRDIDFNCDYEVHAETEEEILNKAAEHAQTVHHMKEISEEVVARVWAAIRIASNLALGATWHYLRSRRAFLSETTYALRCCAFENGLRLVPIAQYLARL